jgi:transposase-like protein
MSKVSTHPDTEVSERPSRRKYSAKYKLQILNEIDSSARTGEIGAILRREGLYASTVASWRMQKERGQLEGLSPKKRGPKSNGSDERDKQIKELELQNRKLQRKLARAHLLLDIQKKISEITGIPLSETEDEEDD